MEIVFPVVKLRKEFGKHCKFTAIAAVALYDVAPRDNQEGKYRMRNPSVTQFDTAAHMSEHQANTERVQIKTSSMRHVEGGWPKEIDFTDNNETNRSRRKAEKDEDYRSSVKALGPVILRCMRQNNTIDIYEEYFDGDHQDHSSEPPSAKGLAVFRDPNETKRTVTSINWHPDPTMPAKVAVSYSILSFQDPRFMNSSARMPHQSYIWDIMNPNTPDVEILPPSPLCCLRYNPKSPDILAGGSYNGLVTTYDIRKNSGTSKEISPTHTSMIENSHHDPVYDIFWINSKTGNQLVTVSTDGRLLWWDAKKLNEPLSDIKLQPAGNTGPILGGSSLEYNSEAGATKYLVGTEQGVVLLVNTKAKAGMNVTTFDGGPGKHHGPIYSIQRNPSTANWKCFLTIGDWTARVWMEDTKTPIMTTKYHSSYLTSGCWSPTRAGVFFVTRMDGVMDIWDYFYRQNEVAYSHKVGDSPLSSIAVHYDGKHVAIGDTDGTVSLLEVCESLAVQQSNEKRAIESMFEREMRQEKNLETREKDLKKAREAEDKARLAEALDKKKNDKDDHMEQLLRRVDADFLDMIKQAEDDESKGQESLAIN